MLHKKSRKSPYKGMCVLLALVSFYFSKAWKICDGWSLAAMLFNEAISKTKTRTKTKTTALEAER